MKFMNYLFEYDSNIEKVENKELPNKYCYLFHNDMCKIDNTITKFRGLIQCFVTHTYWSDAQDLLLLRESLSKIFLMY